jgi:hypothetical protein
MRNSQGTTYFERSDRNVHYWATRRFVGPDVADRIQKSAIIICPWEGFRDYNGPVFPVGTESFYGYLRNHAPEGIDVEIAVDDSEYTEVALHGALVIVGSVLIVLGTGIGLPVVASLISDSIKARFPKMFGRPDRDDRIRIQISVEEGDRVISATIEAPPALFEDSLSSAFAKIEGDNIIDAEWFDASSPPAERHGSNFAGKESDND